MQACIHLALHCLVSHFDVRHVDELQIHITRGHMPQRAIEDDGVQDAFQHLADLMLLHLLQRTIGPNQMHRRTEARGAFYIHIRSGQDVSGEVASQLECSGARWPCTLVRSGLAPAAASELDPVVALARRRALTCANIARGRSSLLREEQRSMREVV